MTDITRGSRITNLVVARLFEEIAQSLELAGEATHRARAYRRAARAVAAADALEVLAAQGRLRDIPGVGAALEALIAEFLQTGRISTHQKLIAQHPPGLAPLLLARGFGPSSVHALHDKLGVTDLDSVEAAAATGQLAQAIGARRAEELVAQLPGLRNPIPNLRLKSAWETVSGIRELLHGADPRPRAVEVVGAARRLCESVVGGLDLLAMPDHETDTRLLDWLERLPGVVRVDERTDVLSRVRMYDRTEVRLHLTSPGAWGAAEVWLTGSISHIQRLVERAAAHGLTFRPDGLSRNGTLIASSTEEEIYHALDLQLIPPELREDTGEIEAAAAGVLPHLIALGDLRGDLHCHTEWTDGSASLDVMAEAARDRGYAYMALTDHSRSLTITNGLSLERLEHARSEVARINARLAPFVVLLGTEMDILEDGRLDYPDDVLRSLDYVSASIHSRFKQTEDQMTPRILRAVEHPLVHTLNHPHGRLLGARPAYAVDMPRVIAAAVAAGTALEVSGDPARMDLDGGWARHVREAGGFCTISSDAHSTLDYDNIWLGVASARRGWLEPRHVLNTRPLDAFKAHLQRA